MTEIVAVTLVKDTDVPSNKKQTASTASTSYADFS